MLRVAVEGDNERLVAIVPEGTIGSVPTSVNGIPVRTEISEG